MIVCLNLFEFVVTSQAAYNPGIDVSCLWSTTRQPSVSFSRPRESTGVVFGIVQTATNIQSALRVFQLFKIISSTNIDPVISSTSSFKTNSILSFSLAFSIQESSALKVSLL